MGGVGGAGVGVGEDEAADVVAGASGDDDAVAVADGGDRRAAADGVAAGFDQEADDFAGRMGLMEEAERLLLLAELAGGVSDAGFGGRYAEQGGERRGVLDAGIGPTAEAGDDFFGQVGEGKEAAQAPFGEAEPEGHARLVAPVVFRKSVGVGGGAEMIRAVAAVAVVDLGEAEGLLVGQLAWLDEEAELGQVAGAQEGDGPVAAGAAHHFKLVGWVVRQAADDGGDLLPALAAEAFE